MTRFEHSGKKKNSLSYRMMDFLLRRSGVKVRNGVRGSEAEDLFRKAAVSKEQVPKVPYRYLERNTWFSETEVCGQPCFRILPKKGGEPDRAILYLFGGGFMTSASPRHFKCAAELAQRTDSEVWLYCYPLEPSFTIHEIVEAVAEVYREMLKGWQADEVTFFGLSSGACLCLYLLNYINHEKIDLPYPKRLVLNSPVVELPPTASEYRKMQDLDALDAVLPAAYFGPDGLTSLMVRQEPEETRYLSRILEADMTGWPPVTLIYGTNEVPYAYAEDLIRTCRKNGVEITGVKVNGGGHCCILYQPSPEARQLMDYVTEVLT